MSGLVLKLNPRERVLVNGAVIENGDRRSKFSILTPNANILRLRDAIRPDETTTPVRRVCYIAQLVLSGDVGEANASVQLLSGIDQIQLFLFEDNCILQLCAARTAVTLGDYYRTLKCLRALLPYEDALILAQKR